MAAGPRVLVLRSRLGVRARATLTEAGTRPAAVLVPLFGSDENLELVLFERSANVLEHKGEICFPGGSAEASDAGPIETALREAEEELALPRGSVDVIGLLDDVPTTVSNYVITPVVGHVAGDPSLVGDPLEVARIIRVPLARLLEPGVESAGEWEYRGVTRMRYAYTFDGNHVWGATGRILHSLVDVFH